MNRKNAPTNAPAPSTNNKSTPPMISGSFDFFFGVTGGGITPMTVSGACSNAVDGGDVGDGGGGGAAAAVGGDVTGGGGGGTAGGGGAGGVGGRGADDSIPIMVC